MAPAALIQEDSSDRDGRLLEETSDLIDEVNALKASQPQHSSFAQYGKGPTFKSAKAKDKTQFRQYDDACDRVKNFYREQHAKQTVAYNIKARSDFESKTRDEMTVWQAMEKLNSLLDDSDPDTSLSQIQHLLQSAEAIRRDGKPRWMQLTGLIHDLGKLLFFYGSQGQWDVVGDTFPVGCAFDSRIVYPDTFEDNPDSKHPIYSSEYGIYSPGCGMDKVMLSWGHDEYLSVSRPWAPSSAMPCRAVVADKPVCSYHVVKDQSKLPAEALAMIRYHSFYPWHKENAYRHLMDEHDAEMLEAVRAFNPYDLYSKSDDVPDIEELKPYYLELIDEFFPNPVIRW